ncbi:MAG: hypothetical protein PUE04_09975 [Lachnospira sp.]|nr:hypothetical protein [Lachnospira sp.]
MKHNRRGRILIAVLLAAQYVSLYLVYGEDLCDVPLLGLAAATAGAALRQASGKGAGEFAAFALIWWLVTILLTGDTYEAWGRKLLSGLLGGGVLLAGAFLLRMIAARYWKRHNQEGELFARSDCAFLALPGFYFGIAVGVPGFLIELLLALTAGNVRLDRRIPTGVAAFVSCWLCALLGERFMTWYIGFF